MPDRTETLMKEALVAGDRPSLLTMGVVVAKALDKFGQAFITSDVLGRVVVMPKEAVTLLAKPLLKAEDLDLFDEEEALNLMVQEGRTEPEMMTYLRGRASRKHEGSDDE